MMPSPKKQLYCITIFVFLFIAQTEECGGGSTGSQQQASLLSANGITTAAPGAAATATTVAPGATTTALPTCSGTEPTGVLGVNMGPESGNCMQPCSLTSCAGFNWPAVRSGFEYVLYANTKGAAGRGCLEELQNIRSAGLILSAQHEGIPSESTGAAQAEFFFNNGGAWVDDGLTLPGTLHMQHADPGCFTAFNAAICCYGKSIADMRAWIADFAARYLALSGRTVILSTDAPFWKDCTDNWDGLAANPLTIANADDPTCGTAAKPNCPIVPGLPWSMYTFWLNKKGPVNGVAASVVFQDRYEGSSCKLRHFAKGQ